MTTPVPVKVPADLRKHLKANPRTAAIDEHGFDLDLAYW
jgi:hypothetical protein